MAYPTGSGSEILGRVGGKYLTASTTTIFTVPSLHIYTMISAHFCRNGAAENTIFLKAHDGAADRELIINQTLSNDTFVWNEKVVLMGGDALKLTLSGTAQIDFWVSYIDQDWT